MVSWFGAVTSFFFLVVNVLGRTRIKNDQSGSRPNIAIFILDNWDSVDQLPYIKELHSNEGLQFTSHIMDPYTTSSRAALMTGRYPFRYGLQSAEFTAESSSEMPDAFRSEVFLSQYLSAATDDQTAYSTHYVGLWQLGFETWGDTPNNRGFQSFAGHYLPHSDSYKHTITDMNGVTGLDLRINDAIATGFEGYHCMNWCYDRSVETLDYISAENNDNPFLMYISVDVSHTDANDNIQNIVSAMKQRNLWSDTLAIFLPGKGGIVSDTTTVRRSGMMDGRGMMGGFPMMGGDEYCPLWDGDCVGIAMICGGMLPRWQYGRTVSTAVHITDWVPTILAATQRTSLLNDDRITFDGVNLWDAIRLGGFDRLSQQRSIIYSLTNDCASSVCGAIRMGDYKLVMPSIGADSCQQTLTYSKSNVDESCYVKMDEWESDDSIDACLCGSECLVDLSGDSCEYSNVASDNSEMVRTLTEKLVSAATHVVASPAALYQSHSSTPESQNKHTPMNRITKEGWYAPIIPNDGKMSPKLISKKIGNIPMWTYGVKSDSFDLTSNTNINDGQLWENKGLSLVGLKVDWTDMHRYQIYGCIVALSLCIVLLGLWNDRRLTRKSINHRYIDMDSTTTSDELTPLNQ